MDSKEAFDLLLKNLKGVESGEDNEKKKYEMEALVAQINTFPNWKDIQWLKSITNLPILIDGILTAEDAELAVEAGASGLIVSNRRACRLEHVVPTIVALEEYTTESLGLARCLFQVVLAAKGRVPVLLDGGVRHGTDVFKALALGAQAVLVGRPIIYGLAIGGEQGANQVLEMLREELDLSLSLAGCSKLRDIARSHIQTESERLLARL